MAARCANADEEVIRILYYDCAPFRGTVQLPVSGNDTEFKGDDVWLKDLARRRLFAVRRGVLKFRGWRPREIPIPGKKLTDADFAPIFEQKGVDMRIGLDIANLAANNIVVLADVDTDRRHLICRFAGHASCSFCYLHPKPKGALWSTVGPSH